MNNFEELKKAALGANLHGWTGFEDALNDDGYSEAVSKFIGHCRPSEILALIAQLEAAQKLNPLSVNVSELEATYIGDIRLHMAAISNWKLRAEKADKERDELEMSQNVANDATCIWKGRAKAAETRLLVPVKLPSEFYFHSSAENIPVMRARHVEEAIRAAGFLVEGGSSDH